jgi:hypothetical protein
LPYWLLKIAAACYELVWYFTGRDPKLTRQVVEVYKHNWTYTSNKAVRELNYRTTPLRQGLETTINWLRDTIVAG